jgi:hypothetical protein
MPVVLKFVDCYLWRTGHWSVGTHYMIQKRLAAMDPDTETGPWLQTLVTFIAMYCDIQFLVYAILLRVHGEFCR